MTDSLEKIVAEMREYVHRWGDVNNTSVAARWADRLAALGSAGEPFAWANTKNGETYLTKWDPREVHDNGGDTFPLYTHPARADLEGWVMVPKDPTHQMCPSQGLRAAWAWALAAAPQPPRPAR